MGIPLTERPIHVYTCMTDPNRKPVAMIEGIAMVFEAPTPLQAKKAAADWAAAAIEKDKLLSKAKKRVLLQGAAK